MGMLDKVQLSRRMCPIIFLLDTSGSMDGAPIGAVNEAMENLLPELNSMNENNPDVEIKVAAMTFDSDVRWLVSDSELMSVEDFHNQWRALDADGLTAMGEAFTELNEKLSVSHGFMANASGSVAPVIFLMSDGGPTDNYVSGLNLLKKNNWYKCAAKVAIGYSDESNDDILREFTGNVETVLHTNDANELKKLIRFVTITSAMVASGNGVKTVAADEDVNDTTNDVAKAISASGGAAGIAAADADEDW